MIAVHTFTEAGGHPLNEDFGLVQAHPASAEFWVCCLADGQGGRAGGSAAAQLACRFVMEAACRAPVETLLGPNVWQLILQHADRAVAADTAAGFTTLIGFCVSPHRIVGASSGDSALLLVNGGDAIILTAAQAKNPPVGSGVAAVTEFAAALGDNWTALAMTDGVWKYVGWDRVMTATTALHGPPILDTLQQAARLPRTGQFQDDFTAVLLERMS